MKNEKSFIDHDCQRYSDDFYALLESAPSAIVDNEADNVKKAFEITKMDDYGKFDVRLDSSGRYFFIDSKSERNKLG